MQITPAHLCGTLPERSPLDPGEEATEELLVEVGLDDLDLLDPPERERKVCGNAGSAGREVGGGQGRN